jgi:hypothetical protein
MGDSIAGQTGKRRSWSFDPLRIARPEVAARNRVVTTSVRG